MRVPWCCARAHPGRAAVSVVWVGRRAGVFCRVRPLSQMERGQGAHDVFSYPADDVSKRLVILNDARGKKTFEFDRVFDAESTAEQVFEDVRSSLLLISVKRAVGGTGWVSREAPGVKRALLALGGTAPVCFDRLCPRSGLVFHSAAVAVALEFTRSTVQGSMPREEVDVWLMILSRRVCSSIVR